MRNRQEIQEEHAELIHALKSNDGIQSLTLVAMLEILLDIREMLKFQLKPPSDL